ncbi:C1 family peptidase [Methylomarinum vadi]|uniref:C1 family peptidase n=1 Tax=Methylomarinum vadi TaxID=438855 RepID=UPI0004DF248D|nr:C1 family peptidase [Methylomarinum vadi]
MDEITVKSKGMGWHRDLPDYRDYTPEHREIKPLLKKMNLAALAAPASLPNSTDLRAWCSSIEDQQDLGSCTAQAGAGLIEFYERKAFGTHIDASRLFLYKVTRNLLGLIGDTGAYLSSTMAAMTLFGVPPEKYWPYTTAKPGPIAPPTTHFDMEPPAFCYAFAQNYQSVKYYRLDPPGVNPADLLQRIKTNLAANMPAMFGFTVYNSYQYSGSNGHFPFPCPTEKVMGGHAVVAVGYDDTKKIKNPICGKKTTGALLIRNSWGTGWGENGYGWLPYDYVLQVLADDWWTLLRQEYVDSKQFGL